MAKVLLAVMWLACMGSFAHDASAQTVTGQIGGTVVDDQKAVLPGATVSVRNPNTQLVRTGRDRLQRQLRYYQSRGGHV
jgi:hypothetical protein